MSLINEALKRTRDATYSGGAIGASAPGNYRLAPAATKPVFGVWHFVVVGAVIVALIAGTYHLARAPIASLQQAITVGERSSAAGPVASEPAPAVRHVVRPLPPTTHDVVSPEQAKAAEDALVERLISRLQAPPAVPVEPVRTTDLPDKPESKLKLQGIMRDHDSFEAMINGYTYRVGDEIQGGRITAIDQRLVHLEIDGRQIELRLR